MRARRVARPDGSGTERSVNSGLQPVLTALARRGGLENVDRDELANHLAFTTTIDPRTLSTPHALAWWINLYNALAIDLALEARGESLDSVLELRSAFDRPVVDIAGEHLSLTDIEHGKIRRFRDPRIHAALVCGSLSCPTLRAEPFDGERVDEQLDDQMRRFLAAGGAVIDRDSGAMSLSRVFLWYGSDLVRPHRMPSLLPVSKRRVAHALTPWLAPDDAAWVHESAPSVRFQTYDWGLGCSVA